MKQMIKSSITFALVSSLAIFTGCGIDNDGKNVVGDNFVSAEVIDDINASTMLSVVQAQFDPSATNAFGYKAVKIIYETENLDGETIEASGLLVIPEASPEYLAYRDAMGLPPFSISMISESHGTIFTDAEAPTNVEVANGMPDYATAVLMTGIAGFAAVIPDYIGYGKSNGENHPYILKDASAQDSLDMINASVRYMTDNNIAFNSQLYVTGYSQGGYNAMALAQKIEESKELHFNLEGVAPMAGPYLVKAFGDEILKSDGVMSVPAFMAYMADSYSNAYTDVRLDDMILESKVPAFDGLFDGTNDVVAVHTKLMLPLGAPTLGLFDADYVAAYEASESHLLKGRFSENNVGQWAAQTKMNLIHCSNDDVIPVELTYGIEQMLNTLGAQSVTTTIIDSVDANYSIGESVHSNCGIPAYQQAVGWFAAIRNGDI